MQRLNLCGVKALVFNFILRINLGCVGLAGEFREVATIASGKLRESARYGIPN